MSSATSTDPGLRPWQLFLLAGMLAATAVVLVSTGQTMSSVIVLSLTVVTSSLVAVAGYRCLSPLVATPEEADAPPVVGRARAGLEREKALVLRTLKELEFDHAMGKTATADYQELRDRLRVRAVSLMRRLDGADYREAIARDLSVRGVGQPASVSMGSTSGAAAPAVPTAQDDPTVRGCAACHTPNDPDARFCKHCGAPLGSEAS